VLALYAQVAAERKRAVMQRLVAENGEGNDDALEPVAAGQEEEGAAAAEDGVEQDGVEEI
jgi:hypothetical protein